MWYKRNVCIEIKSRIKKEILVWAGLINTPGQTPILRIIRINIIFRIILGVLFVQLTYYVLTYYVPTYYVPTYYVLTYMTRWRASWLWRCWCPTGAGHHISDWHASPLASSAGLFLAAGTFHNALSDGYRFPMLNPSSAVSKQKKSTQY